MRFFRILTQRTVSYTHLGKDAVSWTIDKVERKRSREAVSDGQLELDFRAPKPVRKRAKKKEYW